MSTENLCENNLEIQIPTEQNGLEYHEQSLVHPAENSNRDLHYLYQLAPSGIILSIVAAVLVFWFILPAVPDYLYIPWLTFVLLTALVHTHIVKEFTKQKNTIHINNQWAIYNTFITGVTALTFSVGYLLFLPLLDGFTQIVLLLILATMTVAYLPILSVFLPSYTILISAFIIPLVFWIYSLPPETAYPAAALLTISYCTLLVAAAYYSKTLREIFDQTGLENKKVKVLYDIIEKSRLLNDKLKKEIEEQATSKEKVFHQKELAEITLQSIGEGVISTDAFGKIKYVNPVAEVYIGRTANEIKNKHLLSIVKLVDKPSNLELLDPVKQCLDSGCPVSSNENSTLIRRDGLEYAIDYNTTPILDKNKQISGSVMVFRDVTEKRNMERNLDWQAKHDPLTGLINRREFDYRLNRIITKGNDSNRVHALCYIDLDHFKLVNDSCGHQAGDKLLQKIANRLKKITRDTDTLARLGSDEFAIIMYSCNLDKAKLIAEIFREEVFKTRYQWHEKTFTVSASIGIVPLDISSENITEIRRMADTACYKAKHAGGNRVEIYDPDIAERNENNSELILLQDIQTNIDKETFKLFTQKIKPLDDFNDIIFHEVLLRMIKDNDDILTANQFIPLAETYHMLDRIDQWVFKVIMEMIAYGNPLFNEAHMISMNLSQQSIINGKFINYATEMFSDYDIPAGNICFEVKQPQFYGNMEKFKSFITLMKRQGCRIALDEFNYNSTSVKTVKGLSIDYIKLDARQFPQLNKEQDFNYQLVNCINEINHLAGAQTIMKCVENVEVINMYYDLGIDYVQGCAISAPQLVNNTG